MLMLVGAVAACAVPVEDLLDALEGHAVDDRLVASLALDAVERDDPDVVVVKTLEREGFAFVSQGGSHVKCRKTDSDVIFTVIVPAGM